MLSSPKSKFDEFERTDLVYNTVADHNLWTSILTPKGLTEERRGGDGAHTHVPVLVFWHGGGFIVGDRLYEPWWPGWLLEFALSQNAMIVAPDYRLLPEASGADIVDDLHAFWTWFLETFPGVVESESWSVRPDVGRILCAGHSAGGTLALLSALERPDAAVKAILSLYGPLDDSVPELKMARPRMILGSWPPPPRQAEATIRSYVQRTRGTVRTHGDPVEMWELVTCILQQGRLPRMMNQRPDPRLDAIATIEKNRTLPPIWLIHGENDSVVPSSCSTDFIRRVEAIVPDVPKVLSMRPGEHNFDASLTIQEAWIADGCSFLLRYW
ncbi:putative polyketide synthase [Xylariales sp. AK1849]|nr:putative polyketide synthase [Xylariales sp. AK1849]